MSASESYVGKYTKQKLLGKGTFGEAWLVVSTASGRETPYFVLFCNLRMLALFIIARRSYVMKELMSQGWESHEKDKNMVEVVTSTNFGS